MIVGGPWMVQDIRCKNCEMCVTQSNISVTWVLRPLNNIPAP